MSDFDQAAASRRAGRQVLAWFVGGFGIIIAVNVYMAREAIATFPGMEVANSYVASQTFDAERAAQTRLGWEVAARAEAGEVVIDIVGADGLPVTVASATATVGRSTERTDDRELAFVIAPGELRAKADLKPGYWVVRLEMTALDGTEFRQRREIRVR